MSTPSELLWSALRLLPEFCLIVAAFAAIWWALITFCVLCTPGL